MQRPRKGSFFSRLTIPKWIIWIVIVGAIIFVVYRFLAPQTWPWGIIIISLPLWAMAIFGFLGFLVLMSVLDQASNNSQSPPSDQSLNQQLQLFPGREARIVYTDFEDVGGLASDKKTLESLEPIIQWLKNPREKMLGTDIPRGILLTGPSGSGKNLFAYAIAGRAGVPLLEYSASELMVIWVGAGAAYIRNIFLEARKQASKKKPYIVCIDHIDIIGSEYATVALNGGHNAEAHQTLNQLLKELDDEANAWIYVVAITSRPQFLDHRLITQRRLGLRIDLPLPDKDTRKDILTIHLKRSSSQGAVTLSDSDTENIALKTGGWSGAELEQLVNQAAEIAKSRSRKAAEIVESPGTAEIVESPGKESNQQPSLTSQLAPDICLDDFTQALGRVLPLPERKLPREIVEYLDQYVVGQVVAKKRLAVAVSSHYIRIRDTRRLETLSTKIKKSNILLMGPTGSGKTLLIETIAAHLHVPWVIFNSTVLTETGYAGASVEQVLYKLIVVANMNLRKAEYGIICIDEFDKLAFHQGERTRQTGAGVQQELLKIIEGTVIDVPKTGGERRSDISVYYQFDTHNILFICLGAFINIEMVIENRLKEATGAAEKPQPTVQPGDVITYGFIPELIGRFPVITHTEPLTVAELVQVLNKGLVNEYSRLLELQGWPEPQFALEALKRIALEASHRQGGARDLRGIMEEVLLDKMYERPKKTHQKKNEQVSESSKEGQEAAKPEEEEAANGNPSQPLIIDQLFVEEVLGPDQSMSNEVRRLTSDEIIQEFNQQLTGNRQAQKLLAIISSSHYACQPKTGSAEGQVKRHGVLLVDPYINQRLQLVQALAHILKVPYVAVNAQYLEHSLNMRSGQRLTWLLEPVQDLLQKVNNDFQKAQQGIIFIDDFDQTLGKVAVHPSYSTLQQQLGEFIQGRSLPFQSNRGQELEFKTNNLFFVLGGQFRFPGNPLEPFEGDESFFDKYRADNIVPNLITDFGFSSDLLQYLIVIPMELIISKPDLEQIIKREEEQLKAKYQDLLTYHKSVLSLSPEEYRQLANDAEDGQGKAIDIIRQHLESKLMGHLY